MVYADEANVLGDDIETRNENTETLVNASKEVNLEVNVEKTMFMLRSRHQNSDKSRDIKITNNPFEYVSFKLLENDSNKLIFYSVGS
jgi:hypothetical protein